MSERQTRGALRRRLGTTPSLALLALAIVVLAVAGAALAASALAGDDARQQRLAFRSEGAVIAATLQVELQHEQDLELSAGAFMIGHPSATQTQLERWAQAQQVSAHYPELFGLVWIVYVPRAALPAVEQQAAAVMGSALARAVFVPLERARLPYYCLPKLGLGAAPNTPALSANPLSDDLCLVAPLDVSRDSGRALVYSVMLGNFKEMGFSSPIYNGGTTPGTVAARRRAFLGWIAMSVNPQVVLQTALRGHPHTAVVFHRSTGLGAQQLVFGAGATLRGRQQTQTIDLHNGSTLEVLGAAVQGGIFADTAALAILAGGTLVGALTGLLLFLLGTGRARAQRLVEQRTRELAQEAERSAAARDAAVEASNAKSVFVATVSHELRTPLGGVIGTTELLLASELNEEQHEYAEIIRTSSEGLLLVINDILDFSKLEAGKLALSPAGFVLGEVISEACALMLPVAEGKGISLENKLDPALPGWLYGDAPRLYQVLINLLSNAVKFTSEGGVVVRASGTPQDGSAHVRVSVEDTGIGIDEETLARLFQPFVQGDSSTAREYGGTGLGLAISANLIELMGGKIRAESTPGEGSTFWFELTLPLAEPEGREPTTRELIARGERDDEGKLTDAAPLVLVAEDNPVNQMLAARLLDKCGYRSEVVENGLEALAALEREQYAAILMDCQMPELDGYETTRELRRREQAGEHTPVIATTAHSLAGDREKCLAAGMDHYLAKPLRGYELAEVLAQALGEPAADGGSAVKSEQSATARQPRKAAS